jgi:hypothetical protein
MKRTTGGGENNCVIANRGVDGRRRQAGREMVDDALAVLYE